jgi:hypothetical protein
MTGSPASGCAAPDGSGLVADVVRLMREGRWTFPRLGPGFIEEMVLRAQALAGADPGRDRIAALPSYRLAALALKAVDPDVAFTGSDGPSLLLDLGEDQAQPPIFWRAFLRSFNSDGYYPDTPPAEYCRPTADHHRVLDAVVSLLRERTPHTHASFTGCISRILLVQGAPLNGSSPRFFGCLLLPASLLAIAPDRIAAQLVHELAHQELFVLNAYDRLVARAGDDVIRFSAFAGVRRPTMGRLHAAHALFRMIQHSRQTGGSTFVNRLKLRLTTHDFREGELTPVGQTIVDEVYRAV